MKNMTKLTVNLTLALLIFSAGISFAMHHSGGHSGHGSSTPAASGHDAHHQAAPASSGHDAHAGHGSDHAAGGAHDRMEMLGNQVRDGVRATAQISDISKALAAAGMPQTHHLMVDFTDEAGSSTIATGRVAVRVVTPSGQTLPAVSLQGMDGEFGGDIELKEKGKYTLQVGSQVHDNKARQYEFQYEVK